MATTASTASSPRAPPSPASRSTRASSRSSLWHRGGAYRTADKTRLCISPQYCQPWLRPQESQRLIAPPVVAAGLSARLRSMVGYNIHPPFIGQMEGMHPVRLVDPSYRSHCGAEKTAAAEIADRVLASGPIAR